MRHGLLQPGQDPSGAGECFLCHEAVHFIARELRGCGPFFNEIRLEYRRMPDFDARIQERISADFDRSFCRPGFHLEAVRLALSGVNVE